MRNLTIFVHVGAAGKIPQPQIVYGGGGPGQIGGGGASDVRLLPGPYFDESGLKSRIMVAAGDGGHDMQKPAGSGGCLQGFDSDGKGGSQTSGGDGLYPGYFGFGGGNGDRVYYNGTPDGNAGGGGGYFGGGTSFSVNLSSAGGGSSYISGYPGCISVAEDFTSENPKFSTAEDRSIHYSGIKFEDPVMIDGNSYMYSPNIFGSIPEKGHYGNGHVIISTSEKNVVIPFRFMCSCPLTIQHAFDGSYLFVIVNL